jgi:hypothetical protein
MRTKEAESWIMSLCVIEDYRNLEEVVCHVKPKSKLCQPPGVRQVTD